jgi:hypothetical protein
MRHNDLLRVAIERTNPDVLIYGGAVIGAIIGLLIFLGV